MYRHNPQTRKLQALVRRGAIGALRLIRGAFSFTVTSPRDIRLLPELDGGALMDVGCYCVSSSRQLAGEPERVSAEQVTGATGVDVVFAGTLSFPDGVIAHFDAGLALPERDELEVIGEEGTLFLDDPWHCRVPVIELRMGGDADRIECEPDDSYRLELENLSAAIRGEAEPLLGREDAVGNARAIEALYASAESGAPVTL
jgi:predicted dehydrogenase